MGIFDGFQFDPGTYAPQQGVQGLLDALMKQAAGPISPQYDQMGNATGAQSTPFQPQYIGPNAPQPLAPLSAPINVGVSAAQNPGVIPELPRQQDSTYPPNAQPAQFQGQGAPQPQEPGFGERLMAGFQGFTNAAGPIQALGNMVDGFANGATRENMTERALVKAGIDPGMAKTIVKDRGMLTAILPSILGSNLKPTYGVIGKDQFGNEQYGWINPRTQSVTPSNISGEGDAPAGKVMGADGKLMDIPPGVDPKTYRAEMTRIAADAAGGKRTESQAKSAKFASRMELAEKNMQGIESEGLGAGGVWGAITNEIPVVGGMMQGEKFQKFSQARSQFITGLLRDESGAAIGKPEFKRMEKELFPVPGDSAAVIDQKREARRAAIEDARRAAGPGSQPATTGKPSGVTPGGVKWSVQ